MDVKLFEPLPQPNKDETQKAYVSRCIAFVKGEDKGIGNEQAAAMCYTTWRNSKRKEAESNMPRPDRGERQFEFISRCTNSLLKKTPDLEPADATAACFMAWSARFESMHPLDAAISEASTEEWSSANEEKLPASCFLWIEDENDRSKWHMPVYEGAGEIGEDGLYERQGRLNLTALRLAAHFKKRGMPAEVKQNRARLLHDYGIGTKDESAYEVYHEPVLLEGENEISRLVDSVDFSEAEFVENDDGTRLVRNVAMLGEVSSHGYEYKQEAMSRAVKGGLYEGARIFIDHNTKNRSLMTLAGVFRNTRHEGRKVKGNAHLLSTEGGKLFFDIAKHMPEAASCSHVADGKLVKGDGGKKYVEEITKVHSVDLVVQGATTRSVFESHSDDSDNGDRNMDWKDVKIDDLRAARPDLVTLLTQEGQKSRDDEVQALVRKNEGLEETAQELRLKVEKFELAETMREKEAIVTKVFADLPEHARTDSLRKICLEIKSGKDGFNKTIFEEDVKQVVKGIRETIEARGVHDMGSEKVVTFKDSEGQEQKVDEEAVNRALTLD